MIYVTGDIHGNPVRLNTENFSEQKEMTKDDYVIILGDFGLVWDYKGENKEEKHWLDWLDEKPFTTLFIDGNHENHARLDAYEEHDWHNGKVHFIRPSVIHLMRGYVFDIDGQSIFAFGGARSHDISDGILERGKDDAKIKKWRKDYFKMFRIKDVEWWEREMPNEREFARGRESLDKVNWKVDFAITHSQPSSVVALALAGQSDPDPLTIYLEEIRQKLDYTRWLSGHLHMNKYVNNKDILLYEQIIRIS